LDPASLNVAVAFAAGLLSFLSPCVLPLVPAYLTYIASGSASDPRRAVPSALAIVLGLAIVLSVVGLGVTAIGQWVFSDQVLVTRIAGLLVIVLGLHMAGLLRIPLLQREARVNFLQFRDRGVVGAFLMGGAFGIGWTPCVGVTLSAILALAGQSESLAQGSALLFFYSLGMGLPFVAVAFGMKRVASLLAAFRRHGRAVEVASGTLMVAMGALLFTDRLNVISAWFTQVFGYGLADVRIG
jgi:cytochrome c-type biogenesis protein